MKEADGGVEYDALSKGPNRGGMTADVIITIIIMWAVLFKSMIHLQLKVKPFELLLPYSKKVTSASARDVGAMIPVQN